jgi:hypothetical protein
MQSSVYLMLLTPCNFLHSIYFPTKALRDKIYIARIKNPTHLGTQAPSLESYNNKGLRSNLICFVHSYNAIRTSVSRMAHTHLLQHLLEDDTRVSKHVGVFIRVISTAL